MSKATYLHDLTRAYEISSKSRHKKLFDQYKNLGRERWLEVIDHANRQLLRKLKRSVGKANRNNCRLTPLGWVRRLNYADSLASICRRNRATIGIKP